MTDLEGRIAKIRSTGYWTVNIRPTAFTDARIESLGECWDIVESSRVMLRGWDYPHVNDKDRGYGQNWIQSGIDWEEYGHVELWRFYQSGQFVHHFAFSEDYHELPWESSGGKPARYLLWLSTLYQMTEIFEFASRLAVHELLQPGAHISIHLGNTAGRELTHWNSSDYVRSGYVSELDDIDIDRGYSSDSLLSQSSEAALNAAVYVYERFQWLNPPRDSLVERQRRFLERRLRA